jgi:hypothetical protein
LNFVTLCLFVLFSGGFVLSSFNGVFALLEATSALFGKNALAGAAAGATVLTLCTAVTAYGGIVKKHSAKSDRYWFLLLFVIAQALNLGMNFSGVHERVAILKETRIGMNGESEIRGLERLKTGYQRVIEDYPTFDSRGETISYKEMITEEKVNAIAKVNGLNELILTVELKKEQVRFERLDWLKLSVWLILPELCMLCALLGFAKLR